MKNVWYKKTLVLGIIVLFIGMNVVPSTGTTLEQVCRPISSRVSQNIGNGIINITVYEAWELLNDTSNGIQIPIDMRNDTEWAEVSIDTPPPENPIHIPWDNFSFYEFIEEYNGKEIIPYYKTKGEYRFLIFLYNLLSYNFTGTIYLWPGGIDTWIEAGLPIIKNEPPTIEIINPKEYYLHLFGIPLLPIILIAIADCISLGGFKLRPVIINATDDIDNSEDLIVKVYLNGEEQGNASYCCDWRLHEWFWTGRANGIYTLTITAEDSFGAIGSDEIWVRNLCFLP